MTSPLSTYVEPRGCVDAVDRDGGADGPVVDKEQAVGTHYEEARKAVEAGEIAVVVVVPPFIGTLTWQVRECDEPYVFSDDDHTRAVALLTYMEVAHEQLGLE
jgi:hypothetical protein